MPKRLEELYRTLAKGLPGGIAVIVDHDLRYLLADGQGLAVAGLSSADLEGKTIFESLPADFASEYEASFRQALAGRPFVGENLSYGHQYLTHGMPLFDDAGEVFAVLAVSYDVTQSAERAWAAEERTRAQEALSRSEERFRQLVTTVSDFVFEMSPDWSQTYSLTTKELLGDSLDPRLTWIETYLPEDDAATVREAIARAIATKSVFELEHRALQPDGSIGWVYSRAIPLLDDHGEIIEWFGAASDITARKRAEEELRELNETLEQQVKERTEEMLLSQMRFQQAFEVGPMSAAITTLDDDVFLNVNESFTKLTGYEEKEVLGRSALELQMWSDAVDQAKLRAALLEDGSGWRDLELHVRTKDGLVKDILSSGEVIRLDGDRAWLKLFIDVTDRKRSEEELMRAIEAVMSDTTWFGHQVVQRLTSLRSGVSEDPLIEVLSVRERQVLERMARGMTDDQIADDLSIARKTIRNHIGNIYSKLGVNSRTQAVVWARERGIVGKARSKE